MYDNLIQPINVKDTLDQSQIFDNVKFSAVKEDLFGILLTPVCDISQDRVSFYKFCPVLPFKVIFFQKLKDDINVSYEDFINSTYGSKKKDRILQYIPRVLNNQFDRYHWLGKLPNEEDYWLVDYHLVETLSVEQFELIRVNRLYKLLSPIRESVLSRYSNYSGRVGLPSEEKERVELSAKIFEEYKK